MNSEKKVNVVGIIPARWASSRLPGKPLINIGGLPLIERVRRQALKCTLLNEVIVATDDQRIYDTINSFGGKVEMTSPNHHSGTDRLAEVVSDNENIDIAVNIQGDEPFIDPVAIDEAIQPLLSDNTIQMSTIASPIESENVLNPHVVKVVLDKQDFALYFSRAPIPFCRDKSTGLENCYHHGGLYVYRRQCLLQLASLKPTPLELAESLEQLRALENGIKIKVVKTSYRPQEVNVPEDVAIVETILEARQLSQSGNFPL